MDSVGLTSNVLPWPPAAMTGYDTVINGGVYKARSSSEYDTNTLAWKAFDKSSTGLYWWVSKNISYTAGSPNSTTAVTVDANGTTWTGEWIQMQMSTPISITGYMLTPTGNGDHATQSPTAYVLLGSMDGVNWFVIDSKYGVTTLISNQNQSVSLSTRQTFLYFRAVFLNSATAVVVSVGELIIYGTADTSPALTIAPATTFNTSVATPSLTGVVNTSVFTPQDFSSSGLNIPAYVVSNTATVANTVQYSSMGPFAGEGSLYFPGGTGAYVNFGNQLPIWTGGNQDATIEAWIYATRFATNTTPLIVRAPSTTSGAAYSWGIFLYPTYIVFNLYNQAGPTVSQASINMVPPLNRWNHIAATYSGGVLRVFLNGVVGGTTPTLSGVPFYSASSITMLGNWTSSGGNQFPGYIASARIVSGLALYTTTFTPPTGPLQPIQGVTQAGRPYGTVLLLRNAPAPGRIQTTKFSGANSGQVLSFPPAAMNNSATPLNAGYGQGTYVASASSEYGAGSNPAWYAFDKASTIWTSNLGYNTSTGVYTASNVTVDVTGTAYLGEWLQIQKPSSIVLSSYSLSNRTDVASESPNTFYVLGSRDGTSWSLVNSQSNIAWSAAQTKTFTVSASQAFTYYRLGVSTINTSGSPRVSVLDWTLNGTIESVNIAPDGEVGVGVITPTRALEVAGDVVCGGTLSAGNPLMFRNRLINGDFRVDQRGSEASVPVTGYGPDRWLLSSSSSGQSFKRYTLLSASDDVVMKQGFKFGVQINRGSTGLVDLIQSIELGNCSDMFNQPMTLSFWGRASVASSSVVYLGSSPTGTATWTFVYSGAYYLTTNWQYITIPISTPPVYSASTDPAAYGMQIILRAGGGAPNGSVHYYTGIQLEKGTVATPFEVRPYATELALCQRYYQEIPNTNGVHFSGSGRLITTNNATNGTLIGTIQLPVPMRAFPTPTYYGGATTGGVITCLTSSSGAQVEKDIAASNVTSASMSGITHGFNITNGGALPVSGGASTWIDMSWSSKRFGITFSSEL